jgi:hypothetical protein
VRVDRVFSAAGFPLIDGAVLRPGDDPRFPIEAMPTRHAGKDVGLKTGDDAGPETTPA